MPEVPTISQRIRYAFDNVMARGSIALIGLLLVLTLRRQGAHPAQPETR